MMVQVGVQVDKFLNVIDRVVHELDEIKGKFNIQSTSDLITLPLLIGGILTVSINTLIKSIKDKTLGKSFSGSESELEVPTLTKLSTFQPVEAPILTPTTSSKKSTFQPVEVPILTPTTSAVRVSKPSSKLEIKTVDVSGLEGNQRVRKLIEGHTIWKVTTPKEGGFGYPGCPTHSIRGRVTNYNECIIYSVEYIMAKAGLDLNGACGITGSLMMESGMLPIAFNRSGGGYGAQGLAQWRSWYKTEEAIKKNGGRGRIGEYVHQYGVMPVYDDNFYHQMDYVCWELNTYSYYRIPRGLSLERAAAHACTHYEGATADPNHNLPSRIKNAKIAYNLYIKVHGGGSVVQRTVSMKLFKTNKNQQ